MKRSSALTVLGFFFVLLLIVLQNYYSDSPPKLPPITQIVSPGGTIQQSEFLFCHWNVENLFDDQFDGRTGQGDREYDVLYATNRELLKHKVARLTDAILKVNAGKGPDILAIVEVESVRAAELLQQALNEKLTDKSLHYRNLLMKEISADRHIAPAILTRLPVVPDRTRTLDTQRRILVGHIVVNDQELIVIASHWPSRFMESGKKGRRDYGDKIHGAVQAMHRVNPAVDVLVSGDFNDDPNDDSVVKHLRATGNLATVRAGGPLTLFNLFAGKDPKAFGSHYIKDWHIFDQIAVTPGLLDAKGWTCDPQSTQVVNQLHKSNDRNKRPWRFGNEGDKGERGYSDHFPVTVKLRIASPLQTAEPTVKSGV